MVYGRCARSGVYLLQELFGLMGLGQTEADVQLVREVLGALPPEHPAQSYVRRAGLDLSSPNGVVDTFLHKRDRAIVSPFRTTQLAWLKNARFCLDPALFSC
jgi:hypothetical protein